MFYPTKVGDDPGVTSPSINGRQLDCWKKSTRSCSIIVMCICTIYHSYRAKQLSDHIVLSTSNQSGVIIIIDSIKHIFELQWELVQPMRLCSSGIEIASQMGWLFQTLISGRFNTFLNFIMFFGLVPISFYAWACSVIAEKVL